MTELVFILDRSGSMSGLEGDTIGGFNSMIEKQKKEEGEALVSTVLFDNESVVIHDRLPLDRVPRMTEKEYFIRGCTALLDAVGGAIHHIGKGEYSVGETKTGQGMRTIILPKSTADVLRQRKAESISQWIFPNPVKPEDPVDPSSAYHHMKTLLKRAGLPSIRFHDLRHPYVKLRLKNLKPAFAWFWLESSLFHTKVFCFPDDLNLISGIHIYFFNKRLGKCES